MHRLIKKIAGFITFAKATSRIALPLFLYHVSSGAEASWRQNWAIPPSCRTPLALLVYNSHECFIGLHL